MYLGFPAIYRKKQSGITIPVLTTYSGIGLCHTVKTLRLPGIIDIQLFSYVNNLVYHIGIIVWNKHYGQIELIRKQVVYVSDHDKVVGAPHDVIQPVLAFMMI